MTSTLQALSLVGKVEPGKVCFTLRLRDQWSMCMQDGCKFYIDFYMASTGSCFMVTWTIFKNHRLEEGLTQNQETMALWMLTTVGYILFYHVWAPSWIESHWNSSWLRARCEAKPTTLMRPSPGDSLRITCMISTIIEAWNVTSILVDSHIT